MSSNQLGVCGGRARTPPPGRSPRARRARAICRIVSPSGNVIGRRKTSPRAILSMTSRGAHRPIEPVLAGLQPPRLTAPRQRDPETDAVADDARLGQPPPDRRRSRRPAGSRRTARRPRSPCRVAPSRAAATPPTRRTPARSDDEQPGPTRFTIVDLESGLRCARLRVEIVLQDDGGRGRIEQRLAFAPVLLALRQQALRFVARQPLVLQHDRHARSSVRKLARRCASTAAVCSLGSPRSRRGQPDHDGREPVAPRPRATRSRAASSPRRRVGAAGAGDRLPRPRQQARRVRQRQADPLPAVVDAERAHRNRAYQRRFDAALD